MASKPYCASGKYIQRMSNYCQDCRFDPTCREGDKACPFTVGFWDFLARNEKNLSQVPRMNMMLANLRKLDRDTIRSIRKHADAFRKRWS
jgi:deoxyribodipyrimidine photolyase-related protein